MKATVYPVKKNAVRAKRTLFVDIRHSFVGLDTIPAYLSQQQDISNGKPEVQRQRKLFIF